MNGFKKYLRIASVLACTGWWITATAQENDSVWDTELSAGIEMFRWQEFDNSGTRLLTESGPRLFFSANINNNYRTQGGFIYEASVRAYTGNVDYDGQDSSGIFTSSETTYSGFGLEFNGGLRVIDAINFDVLAGVGINAWQREIKDNRNALGSPVSGIVEDYDIQYLTLAVGLPHKFKNINSYLKAGLKRPFLTNEDVANFNVTLSPGEKISGFISYQLTLDESKQNLISSIMFYYDSFRFGESPAKLTVVNSQPVQVLQPKSNLDVIGVAIGHVF